MRLFNYFYLLFLLSGIYASGTLCSFAQNCATQLDPLSRDYLSHHKEATARFAQHSLRSRSNEVIRIQAHVMTLDDGSGGISQQFLDQQLLQLNSFFMDMNVHFEMCEPNIIQHDLFYNFHIEDEAEMIKNNRPNVINVYFPFTIIVDEESVCGYTYFPGSNKSVVIISAQCAINGVTLAHEIGHYFSLFHTHGKTNNGTTDELVNGSNCSIAGDDICDTPADPNLFGKVTASCKYIGQEKDSNGQLFMPQPTNLMSYSLDQCMQLFSPQQLNRMRFSLENDRAELLEENPECEMLSLENCQFEVSNLHDSGKGSLRFAMKCANLNPGPDTIRFSFSGLGEKEIEILTALPRLTDDSTVIDGQLEGGGKVVINAHNVSLASLRDSSYALIQIEGKGVSLSNLTIKDFVKNEIQAYQAVATLGIADSAESYSISKVDMVNNLTGIRIGRASGEIQDNIFERNMMAMIAEENAYGIYFRRNTFFCNTKGALEFADNYSAQFVPPPPTINRINSGRISGTAVPGAIVDIFEQNARLCTMVSCQGKYIGSVEADQGGRWEIGLAVLLLNNYSATSSVFREDRWMTSDFSGCQVLADGTPVWLYPNPGDGIFSIEVNGRTELPLKVALFDIYGRQLILPDWEKKAIYEKGELDLRALSRGHYLMRIIVDEKPIVRRIIIQ